MKSYWYPMKSQFFLGSTGGSPWWNNARSVTLQGREKSTNAALGAAWRRLTGGHWPRMPAAGRRPLAVATTHESYVGYNPSCKWDRWLIHLELGL